MSAKAEKSNFVNIDTAVVTIKTLHVGNKQMTLAIFKQLPHGYVFDAEDMEIWGWVNYCPKNCAPTEVRGEFLHAARDCHNAVHIIYRDSEDTQLYRLSLCNTSSPLMMINDIIKKAKQCGQLFIAV